MHCKSAVVVPGEAEGAVVLLADLWFLLDFDSTADAARTQRQTIKSFMICMFFVWIGLVVENPVNRNNRNGTRLSFEFGGWFSWKVETPQFSIKLPCQGQVWHRRWYLMVCRPIAPNRARREMLLFFSAIEVSSLISFLVYLSVVQPI